MRGRFAGIVFAASVLAASGAQALDMDKVKARTLPVDGTPEQAETCASAMMLTAGLLKDPANGGTPQLQAKFQEAAQMWVRAYADRASITTDQQKADYVNAMLLPDEHAWQATDFATYSYFRAYCENETDKLPAMQALNGLARPSN